MFTFKRNWLMVMMSLAATSSAHAKTLEEVPVDENMLRSSAVTSSAPAETLEEVVKQTLSTNPDVLEKMNTRLSVDQEVRQAKAGYYPSIDLNAGIGRENTDNTFTRAAGYDGRGLTRRETGVALRQPLYSGGATSHEVERQTERANSRAYSMHATAEQIALRVTEVYLEVLRRQELVKLAQDNLKSHEKTYDQVSSRSISGIGRGADVDQARSRLLLAKSNLMAEESNLREAEINYFRVVNAAPKRLSMPTAPVDKVPGSLSDAVKQAVGNHPTLKAAAADIEAAKEQHGAARAPYFPDLGLELGAVRNDNISGLVGENNSMYAMLRMRYNLYAGGKDQARRGQAFYQIYEAKEIRNQTCRQVVESMRLSWNAFKTTDAQVVYLRQRVESSINARDSYRSQFTLGQRSLLDLLDSENEVFSASKALTHGEFDRLFSSYRVMTGEGKLLSTLDVALPPETKPLTNNLTEVNCELEFPAQETPQATPLAAAQKATVLPSPPSPPPQQVVLEKIVQVPTPFFMERVTLEAGALFATNKADLTPEGKTELDELYMKLGSVKNIEGLEIVGHTDSRGSDKHNQALSLRRARSVAEHLAARGIRRDLMSAKGMGEDVPVATNKTEAGRAKNRRVEIDIKVTR